MPLVLENISQTKEVGYGIGSKLMYIRNSDNKLQAEHKLKGMEKENQYYSWCKQRLEFMTVLKDALTIPYKNPYIIACTLIVSIPLFCFLVFHEVLLQRLLLEAFESLTLYDYSSSSLLIVVETTKLIAEEFNYNWFWLGLLYLVPLHFFEFCTAVVTVDLASKLYSEEKPTSLEELSKEHMNKAKFKSTFFTSVIVLFLSTCYLIASIWLAANYYVILKKFVSNALSSVLYRTGCVALLVKYLEWSAVWNMTLAISILEEMHGAEALILSAYLNRGREGQGMILMLIFFVSGFGLRLTCFHNKCHERGVGILTEASLLCIASVFKYLVCSVHYRKCKNQRMVKKLMVQA